MGKLLKNREQVWRILYEFGSAYINGKTNDPAELKRYTIGHYLEVARQEYLMHGQMFRADSKLALDKVWKQFFTSLGIRAMSMCYESSTYEIEEFIDMLMGKHERYGDGPIMKWGTIGLVIRLDSKWERYFNLVNNPQIEKGDESLTDTIRDLLGYCVLGVALIEADYIKEDAQ